MLWIKLFLKRKEDYLMKMWLKKIIVKSKIKLHTTKSQQFNYPKNEKSLI
jgi:hypothetical protein